MISNEPNTSTWKEIYLLCLNENGDKITAAFKTICNSLFHVQRSRAVRRHVTYCSVNMYLR
jgi:hypothetical protein